MVERLSKHPALLIRDVLTANWDSTNTAGYDPTVGDTDSNFVALGRGWYKSAQSDPQITLTNFEEGVLAGGVTDASGIQGDGSGTNQDRDGTGLLTAHAEVTGGTDYNGEYAKDIVWLLTQECERILQNNSNGSGDLWYLGASLEADDVDTTEDTPRAFSQASVSYGYHKTPSG